MRSIINWQELQDMVMGQSQQQGKGADAPQHVNWDENADMYNQMAAMEASYTLNQINCFEAGKDDTVLDIGCGPGRITVPMAKRVKKVTSIDTSENMMTYCRQNAQEANVSNVNIRNLDWTKAELGKDLEQHDIVIACRSVGMRDFAKLNAFARKYVVVIAWANADCIPDIIDELFLGADGRGESRHHVIIPRDRRVGYNVMWNTAYDMGFDPNISIVIDGFTKDYASKEEAYADLSRLGKVAEGKERIFQSNVDQYLSLNDQGGITFRRETKSFVMWWEPKLNMNTSE